MMMKHRLLFAFCLGFGALYAQSPILTPQVVPGSGEMFTYKLIKTATDIDTSLTGENLSWDFHKVKDTTITFSESYREPSGYFDGHFENVYTIDSSSVYEQMAINVTWLDSSGYYRMGYFEKPRVPDYQIPYTYPDTLELLHFPMKYGDRFKDRFEYEKGGRKHHRGQYTVVNIKYDAAGMLILPNNDTCTQAIRIRREENIFETQGGEVKRVRNIVQFFWYQADAKNYVLKVYYSNGTPGEAWYLKKRSRIKTKRN